MNYKFSIITPEHDRNNIPNLLELYESIQNQSYDIWEWILYVNGDCNISDIPLNIRSDKRVKIYNGESHENIGFIKNKAFHLGKGDILVEVDHDDLISEDCLEELNNAYQDSEIGFVYSNALLYDFREPRVAWDSLYGWTHTVQNFRGEDYFVMDSFLPNSRSLALIWYAPDHVRSWRKSVYQELGGHNLELNICDDHDLIIRTYLNSKLKFIPKVLYYYRFLPEKNNTQLKRLDSIQKKTFELCYQYAFQLAERDAELNNLLKVDLGGGLFPKSGYLTIDQQDADINCDLNDGIPLPDNSVGVINASHVIEHLKDPIKTMSEIHRVLCDGGWAFIEVPSTDGRGAWQDPTHVSYWNQNSFWYYTRDQQAQYIRNTKIRFQEYRLDTVWWSDNIAITNAWLCAIKSDEKRPHPEYWIRQFGVKF